MKNLIAFSSIAILLAACGPSPQPVQQSPVVYQQAPAPQVVYQQAPAPQVVYQQAPVVVHDNSASNLAVGMALGAALSTPRTTVIHHYAPAPAPTTIIQKKTVIVNNNTTRVAPRSYGSFGRRR